MKFKKIILLIISLIIVLSSIMPTIALATDEISKNNVNEIDENQIEQDNKDDDSKNIVKSDEKNKNDEEVQDDSEKEELENVTKNSESNIIENKQDEEVKNITERDNPRLMSIQSMENSDELTIAYRTHVENEGWQEYVQDGEMSGTSGKGLRLEAIDIKLLNNTLENMNIKYQVHIQDIGWQDWKSNGEMAGTSGQSKRLEGIRICLENSNEYSVTYRVHIQDIGWQDWKFDGDFAGTEGQSKRLEAIEIKIIPRQIKSTMCIDIPQDDSEYSDLEKINVQGWKMADIADTYIRAFIDNTEIDSNLITYYERPDVIEVIKGYGTIEENPKPGYKFNINASQLESGKHTLKINMYSKDSILTSKTATFKIDKDIHVKYRTHVQSEGWQEYVQDGEMSGTEGKGYRLEAIDIKLLNNELENINIKYQVHIQDTGWQDWKSNGEMAGTSGQSKRLEGIRICLENTENYSVMYRVHVQDIGWQDWKYDGDFAGTEGQSKRLEAIEIKIIPRKIKSTMCIDTPKGGSTYYGNETKVLNVQGWKMADIADTYIRAFIDNTEIDSNLITYYERPDVIDAIKGYGTAEQNPKPGYNFNIDISTLIEGNHTIKIDVYHDNDILTTQTTNFNIDRKLHVKYSAHVQDIGWQDWKVDEQTLGTEGQSLRIEALKIQLYNVPDGVHVKYRVHIEGIGWQDWKQDSDLAGTIGQSKRIEAVQIKIEGLDGYVVEYQSHVQEKGWQQWASNEMISGTVNQSLRVEALKIRLVKSENTVVPQIKYSSHSISQGGWSDYLKNGDMVGSDESGINIEAIKIELENASKNASVSYQVHSSNVGWQDYVANNVQAGVIATNKAIEAIKVKIDGLQGYSVEYRVYVNGQGWQDWARDDRMAGTTGESKQIGAIQIRLNIDAYPHNESNYSSIDISRYPGYKELLDTLQGNHPDWSIKLLYTGLKFNDAVYGEYSRHGANVVPNSSGSEWICPVCGTKPYDTGSWYCASDKAIAYYMDPRNFLNETNIFQFLDANKYEPSSVSLAGIQSNINGTFLENYASDIDTACRNQGVNPYYVISRLIQENGRAGSSTSRGMADGDGNIYYNPFNIGAYKTETATVYQNALASAKSRGWNTMEKALEGGIVFLKDNWLENYQNTLYQNKFDIDSTNGTSLYSHQYMQNLSAAYTEGLNLRGYYLNADKLNSNLTFIIPVYEGMSSTVSARPSDKIDTEEYPMNVIVNTQNSSLALRSAANTSSNVIARYDKGTVLLSVRRGINSTWQHVVMKDGKVGYMSGEYLQQVSDEKPTVYKAYVKTQYSGGLNVRTGPSTKEGFNKVEYLPDYTPITVIDDMTYKGYEGDDWVQWSRIILEDGRQAFVPSSYVKRN